jgi:hypothetical protein
MPAGARAGRCVASLARLRRRIRPPRDGATPGATRDPADWAGERRDDARGRRRELSSPSRTRRRCTTSFGAIDSADPVAAGGDLPHRGTDAAYDLRGHNPEVAGSNPAPATQKGPHTRAFRLLEGRQIGDFVPIFVPIMDANTTDSRRIRSRAVAQIGEIES